ncbi:hypothetical protein BDZ91DRAFT_785033 [Kalaharituber pfeilii]|nr:hypothetical protein BDZ91DRAFT_785033 [Kalaharituber pfeilii]
MSLCSYSGGAVSGLTTVRFMIVYLFLPKQLVWGISIFPISNNALDSLVAPFTESVPRLTPLRASNQHQFQRRVLQESANVAGRSVASGNHISTIPMSMLVAARIGPIQRVQIVLGFFSRHVPQVQWLGQTYMAETMNVPAAASIDHPFLCDEEKIVRKEDEVKNHNGIQPFPVKQMHLSILQEMQFRLLNARPVIRIGEGQSCAGLAHAAFFVSPQSSFERIPKAKGAGLQGSRGKGRL